MGAILSRGYDNKTSAQKVRIADLISFGGIFVFILAQQCVIPLHGLTYFRMLDKSRLKLFISKF